MEAKGTPRGTDARTAAGEVRRSGLPGGAKWPGWAQHLNPVPRFKRLQQRRLALLRSGARALIEGVEWEVEQGLHLGRALLWLGLFVLIVFVWHVSMGSALVGVIDRGVSALTGAPPGWRVEPGSAADTALAVLIVGGGSVAWAAAWWVLRYHRLWTRLRYLLIWVDVLGIVRFAIVIGSGALGETNGSNLMATQLIEVTPALFVLIALSGALRMNPFVAAMSGIGAVSGQIAVGVLLGRGFWETVAPVAVVALTAFLGMQFVFVLRDMALKAAEERVLERFVPQGLTQRLAHAGGTIPARIVPVTILIADIRGFTTISEPLSAHQAVALLNDFFALMVEPLVTEEAVLDKYLGDGMLAFVEGPDHAARGLRAARNIVAAVDQRNARLAEVPPGSSAALPPLRIGIAVHTSDAFVGSIGAPTRMEYTIIGDAVNVTSRLEGLMSTKAGAERIEATLIASESTVAAAAESGFRIPELSGPAQVAVHGRVQPLGVYYLAPSAGTPALVRVPEPAPGQTHA